MNEFRWTFASNLSYPCELKLHLRAVSRRGNLKKLYSCPLDWTIFRGECRTWFSRRPENWDIVVSSAQNAVMHIWSAGCRLLHIYKCSSYGEQQRKKKRGLLASSPGCSESTNILALMNREIITAWAAGCGTLVLIIGGEKVLGGHDCSTLQEGTEGSTPKISTIQYGDPVWSYGTLRAFLLPIRVYITV